ncbi:MAG: protein-L-isoaspartate(D-aspartate) O-methyltransferase [Bacteroidales bacterium]|nr:protein-L-isoaspartate(D-aspartate) O-methyltransferase [Bacteroidales bacterium]
MVDEIRQKGIKDERVLDAIYKVPRHLFIDSGFIRMAYKDQAFPIGAGQTISQPFTVAFQTQLLNIQKLDKVLEIGTGSGYQAAVLIELGTAVYTIERQRELFLKAKSFLPKIGYKPNFFYGDGYLGLPTYGPFDRILITAAIPEVPVNLFDQLLIGGKLVAPVGSPQSQTMTLYEKINENEVKKTEHGHFVFCSDVKGER